MADDKRQNRRVPYTKAVQVTGSATAAGNAVDIGGGGLAIKLPTELKAGTAITVTVEGAAPAKGTVRWGKPDGGQFLLGVQIDAGDWPALAQFAGVPVE